ncbi:unnamed protein product [Lactuca virosa]|uniref:Uncharacterized protein n=1 Tax=Lactuca virosa TaxID=75947 RepID=A0AAU9M822_9ASTR|nr:unnamed protein product [Lactuca virosa]
MERSGRVALVGDPWVFSGSDVVKVRACPGAVTSSTCENFVGDLTYGAGHHPLYLLNEHILISVTGDKVESVLSDVKCGG